MLQQENQKVIHIGNQPIDFQSILDLNPGELEAFRWDLEQLSVLFDQLSSEQIQKFQEMPWEKFNQPIESNSSPSEEDRKVYGELLQMIRDGKLTMAEILGYGETELYKIYSTAVSLGEQGRFPDALKLAEGLLFLSPKLIPAFILKGELLRKAGLLEQAVECYDEAITLEPESIELHFERARVFYVLKDTEKFLDGMVLVATLDAEQTSDFGRVARQILSEQGTPAGAAVSTLN